MPFTYSPTIIQYISYYYLLLIGLFFLTSCRKKPLPPPTFTYLALSHTRTYQANSQTVANEILDIRFDIFDQLLLGGDLLPNSSKNEATLQYLDSLFSLSSPTTHWAVGNHDDVNRDLLFQFTQRKSYYAYYHNGICFVILDTQLNNCYIIDKQLELLQTITDTLSHSSHLVLLYHKLISLPDHPLLASSTDSIANGNIGSCHWCTQPNNFYTDVYPLLQQIKANGIAVVVIAGDIGVKVPYFTDISPDNITFLATGIQEGANLNYALVLYHTPSEQDLTWAFTYLPTLYH
jgi:hypothetical protein